MSPFSGWIQTALGGNAPLIVGRVYKLWVNIRCRTIPKQKFLNGITSSKVSLGVTSDRTSAGTETQCSQVICKMVVLLGGVPFKPGKQLEVSQFLDLNFKAISGKTFPTPGLGHSLPTADGRNPLRHHLANPERMIPHLVTANKQRFQAWIPSGAKWISSIHSRSPS